MDLVLKRIASKIPEFCASHWLLRLPLAIVFIQQGLSKFPVTADDAASYELPYLVWWFVAYGELGAGLGLITTRIKSGNVLDFDILDLSEEQSLFVLKISLDRL